MSPKRGRVPGTKKARKLTTYDRVVRVGADPEGVLNRCAEPVALDAPSVEKVARQLIEMVEADQGAVGLAAPQIGHSLRMICLRTSHPGGSPYVVMNPEVEPVEGCEDDDDFEGCFSLPGKVAKIKRPGIVVLRGSTPMGAPVKVQLTGILARAAQHEVDHLDGVLISERGELGEWVPGG